MLLVRVLIVIRLHRSICQRAACLVARAHATCATPHPYPTLKHNPPRMPVLPSHSHVLRHPTRTPRSSTTTRVCQRLVACARRSHIFRRPACSHQTQAGCPADARAYATPAAHRSRSCVLPPLRHLGTSTGIPAGTGSPTRTLSRTGSNPVPTGFYPTGSNGFVPGTAGHYGLGYPSGLPEYQMKYMKLQLRRNKANYYCLALLCSHGVALPLNASGPRPSLHHRQKVKIRGLCSLCLSIGSVCDGVA
jgi:hypothetical protein